MKFQVKHIILAISAFFIISCSRTYYILPYHGPEAPKMIEFCQLNEVQSGEIVKTNAMYAGVEEYWGLTSNNDCNLDHQVYLNTEEIYQNEYNKRLKIEFDKLYKNYWKYSLKLKIDGRVEKTTNELGYGHLGLKKIQMVPFQIEIVEKQKLKCDN